MLTESTACRETVNILEAMIFRNSEACIDIGVVSLLSAVAAFIACVVALRFVGASVLRRILPSRRNRDPGLLKAEDVGSLGLQRRPYEPPIRSTGAWGGERH